MKFISSYLALAALSLSFSSLASHIQAPPSFEYQDAQAIFVDFSDAQYNITYDLHNMKVQVETVINFTSNQNGYPLFDLVPDPSSAVLNGMTISTTTLQDPDKQSTLRVLKKNLSAGKHQLKLVHEITSNVVFREEGLASGFWTSDLNDRRYLEQYLPTNLEFDQYKMNMNVKIIGAESKPHTLKTNGKVSVLSENSFEVEYPSFYTASSVYFHLLPESTITNNAQFYYPSIDGRLIPVDIYTSYDVNEFVDATKTILNELETDYGAFPHDQLVIYGNSPSGGMEYSGATATSLKALGHELFHSYHARALMPANGNAGWMDEAIARWRDNNYPEISKLSYESTQLAGHSVWTRKTDRMAYTEGSAFLSWIAYRMSENGLSLKEFLKDYFQKFKFTTVTTPQFQNEITIASGLSLKADFDQYIYGKNSLKMSSQKTRDIKFHADDEFHPKLTAEQLLELTWPL